MGAEGVQLASESIVQISSEDGAHATQGVAKVRTRGSVNVAVLWRLEEPDILYIVSLATSLVVRKRTVPESVSQ